MYFEIRAKVIHKITLACSTSNVYLTSWFQAATVENLNCSFVSVYRQHHLHSLHCCCYFQYYRLYYSKVQWQMTMMMMMWLLSFQIFAMILEVGTLVFDHVHVYRKQKYTNCHHHPHLACYGYYKTNSVQHLQVCLSTFLIRTDTL